MKVLAIDTATPCCSVALRLGENCRQRAETVQAGHSSLVLGMARELLDEAGIGLRDLDLVAVDIGPGSFTGLRIGIGVAQGLAYGAGLPARGIVSLAALSPGEAESPVLAALDARMGQVYWGLYRRGREVIAPRVDDPATMLSVLQERSWECSPSAAGNGWSVHAESLPGELSGHPIRCTGVLYPQAREIAALAADESSGRGHSPMQLRAFYVRNQVAKKPG